MNTLIKKHFGLTIVLVTTLFWITGCMAPDPTPDWHQLFEGSDPLKGWKLLGFESPNKEITDDYQAYIQQHNMRGYAGPIQVFEDGTGQHAIEFEVFEHNKNASWHYAFIYDKENKRIKVIKYCYARYQS
jgi:hypothetical protein